MEKTEGQEYVDSVLEEKIERKRQQEPSTAKKVWDFFTKKPYFSTGDDDRESVLDDKFVRERERMEELIQGNGPREEPWSLTSSHPDPANVGSAYDEFKRQVSNMQDVESAYNALKDAREHADGDALEGIEFALDKLQSTVGKYVDALGTLSEIDVSDDLTANDAEAGEHGTVIQTVFQEILADYVENYGEDAVLSSLPDDVETADDYSVVGVGIEQTVSAFHAVVVGNEESVSTHGEAADFVRRDLGRKFLESSGSFSDIEEDVNSDE